MKSLLGLLDARIAVYTLLQKMTGNEPDEALLQLFFSDGILTILELFDSKELPEYSASIGLRNACRSLYLEDRAAFLELSKTEYVRNFIGPDHLEAPPWESAIISNDRLLLQKSTLKVRQFYASEGFRADLYPHVADDHLAYELDFLRCMSELCRDAYRSQETVEYKRLLNRQEAFLDSHLLTWVGAYANILQNSKTKTLYPQLALLIKAFLKIDRELLSDLSARAAEAEF